MSNSFKIAVSFFTICIIIFSSFFIKEFRIDASSDTLVAQNDDDFIHFSNYQKIFPSKNSLIVAIESDEVIDLNLLNEINDISSEISKLPEISSVFNINKAPILFLNDASLIDLSSNNYETILNTKFKISDVLNEFAKSPIYSNQIINNDKNITSLIIFLKKNEKLEDLKIKKEFYLSNNTYYKIKSEIDEDRKKLISNIRNIIKNSESNYTYYLGGIEMITNDVITFVKNDIFLFSFLVLLLVLIILYIIFKKIKWVFVIFSSSILSVYFMIGIVGFLNFEITAISANFISLMFILSISMNVHILNNYLQIENNLKQTMKIMFWPCFYTFLTTVVAFLSLIISDIKPVIDFGIIMIISLFVVLLSAFTILPLMISIFNKDNEVKYVNFSIIKSLFNYSDKFSRIILFINLILFSLSIYGILNLSVENSFIKYFKKDTEIFKGMKLIDTELGGTTPLDIIIKFNTDNLNVSNVNEDDLNESLIEEDIEFEEDIFSDDIYENTDIWFTKEKLLTIKKIHQFLESRDEIGKVVSIYSLLEVANKINKSELSTFELSILYNEIPEDFKKDLIDPFLNIEKNMVRISARVKDSMDIKRSELIENIKFHGKKYINDDVEIRVNGLLVLYNNMLSSLFSSQIKSLGFVLLSIFIMFIILFKSIKLSVVGIIPNIFASTFILGLIGLLKIPLDIMTITIAAISIGIAVDNTIHYLYRYKNYININNNYIEAIKKTHLNVGKAVLITSLAISLGFLTLCFSNFVPTIIFGLFTSLAMIFAMIGVLITLPSILKYLR